MKRGKRFIENDSIIIYVGTIIFFLFAIALGIIMYMMSKTATKLENEKGQFAQEQQTGDVVENASTEIGKTVEEQESSEIKDKNNPTDADDSNDADDVDATDDVAGDVSTGNAKNIVSTVTNNKTNASDSAKSENAIKSEKTAKPEVVDTEANPVDEPDTSTNTSAKNEGTETKKEVTFAKPTDGEIICAYAKDNLIYSETLKEWITHTAVDIKADKTSVIKSAADGIIKSIVNDPRYGLTVVIEHDDGYQTVYSNLLTAEFVVEGEEVTQGQTIGTAGNTASFESSMECHLHFELLKDGEYLDPAIYLK